MFEHLRDNAEDYAVEATEYNNEEEDNSHYQICIRVKDGNEYYVDDCDDNWLILRGLNSVDSHFIYLKDSSEREGGLLGIRVSEIVVFYPEEDYSISE